MEHKYYTEEQILEALSEVGVGAGDTSEVLSYLSGLPSVQPERDEDLVSRSYLLAEYDKRHKGIPGGARKIIEEAPYAQPERKTGKWICEPHPNWGKWGIHIARCSECGFSGGAGKWNFCPNCGARMEVKDD